MSGADDGRVMEPSRVADHLAILDLATAYAHAVDDGDWARWEALFVPDAHIDYTAAGGVAGTPAEVAAWMPDAMAVFSCCLHATSTHEVRFTGENTARGRVLVLNRNGVVWEGRPELVDVGAVYDDTYVRVGAVWRFASRVEHTRLLTGGEFAEVVRDMAARTRPGISPPFG